MAFLSLLRNMFDSSSLKSTSQTHFFNTTSKKSFFNTSKKCLCPVHIIIEIIFQSYHSYMEQLFENNQCIIEYTRASHHFIFDIIK